MSDPVVPEIVLSTLTSKGYLCVHKVNQNGDNLFPVTLNDNRQIDKGIIFIGKDIMGSLYYAHGFHQAILNFFPISFHQTALDTGGGFL